jgi:hypothetical protein
MKIEQMAQMLFIIICLTTYSLATAQSDYVVTIQGDTIKGKLKYLNYKTAKSVQVITPDGKKSVHPILKTKGFTLKNEVYHTVRRPEAYTYMKLVKDGYLKLYSFQQENQTTWDGRYLLKSDGSGQDVPNLTFKKTMTNFLLDCPSVIQKIEKGELTKTDINQIVDEYNNVISERTEKMLKEIEVAKKASEKSTALSELETAIKNGSDFEGRSDALDMIADIKSKLVKGEKIPNFVVDGLKNTLQSQTAYAELLEKALGEINK